MTYEKTDWVDRMVEKPNTFIVTQNSDGTITLTPAPGQVIERGTPINAVNLNKIENKLFDLANIIFLNNQGQVVIRNSNSGEYLILNELGDLRSTGDVFTVHGQSFMGTDGNGDAVKIATISKDGAVDLGDLNRRVSLTSFETPTFFDGEDLYYLITEKGGKIKGGLYFGEKIWIQSHDDGNELAIRNLETEKRLIIKVDSDLVKFYSNNNGFLLGHDVYFSGGLFPDTPGGGWVGDDSRPFYGFRAAGGGFNQSSDVGVKEDVKLVDDEVYFNLIKMLPVHSYIYKDIESRQSRTQATVGDELLNIGIIAQEALTLNGAEFFLTGNEEEGFSVNIYCFSAAIMSALKAEISKREALQKRLEVVEKLLNIK